MAEVWHLICIDGGSATGKTTIGQLASEQLKLEFLDTGLLYRYVALQWLQQDSLDQATKLIMSDIRRGSEEVLESIQRVSTMLFSTKVETCVAEVAAHRRVRVPLTDWARRWARRRPDVVVVGRDTGSFVFPSADLKVFLTADLEVQARRRRPNAVELELQQTMAEIDLRDSADRQRALAPLRPAHDALVIDVNERSVTQVLGDVLGQYWLLKISRPSSR